MPLLPGWSLEGGVGVVSFDRIVALGGYQLSCIALGSASSSSTGFSVVKPSRSQADGRLWEVGHPNPLW